MAQKKIVHIVGTGTIGEPLICILSTFKEQFGIDEVTFHKRTPLLTDRSKVLVSCDKGAKLAVDKDRWQKFVDMGMCRPSKPRSDRARQRRDRLHPGGESE
jgi:glyceraldehyde-3-phosphate dehydrogenase (NAD(P))